MSEARTSAFLRESGELRFTGDKELPRGQAGPCGLRLAGWRAHERPRTDGQRGIHGTGAATLAGGMLRRRPSLVTPLRH